LHIQGVPVYCTIMADSKIAVVYEGSFGQDDGYRLILDRLESSVFIPSHNDRLESTDRLIGRMRALSTGVMGAELADCYNMTEYGTGQHPRRRSKKERLAKARMFIFGPVAQASGMLLVKSAIDSVAAQSVQEDGMPILFDADNWVDIALAQNDVDSGYVNSSEENTPAHFDWFARRTGERDPEMQRRVLSIVCRAVVELPDFDRPQQLAYRGSLATFYRFDNTPYPA
jgi:hypothetical protein